MNIPLFFVALVLSELYAWPFRSQVSAGVRSSKAPGNLWDRKAILSSSVSKNGEGTSVHRKTVYSSVIISFDILHVKTFRDLPETSSRHFAPGKP